MEALGELINKANLKALLIGRLNVILVAVLGGSMIVSIACWAAAVNIENSGLTRRYAASIIGLLLQVICGGLVLGSQRLAPSLLLYYAQELATISALAVTGIAMGMNNVVVNVCATGNVGGKTIACAAHYVELLATVVACLCLMVCYAASQQRVVTFVDKGILDGIKGRSNGGMQQLP